MEHLPAMDFNEMRGVENYNAANNEYNIFLMRIAEILGDCFAITINNEVVFNRRAPGRPRDKILESMISSQIMNNPHMLFIPVFEDKLNSVIQFYMSPAAPWFCVVSYNSELENLQVTFYKSNEYVNKYG
jgi:hypothetical protein